MDINTVITITSLLIIMQLMSTDAQVYCFKKLHREATPRHRDALCKNLLYKNSNKKKLYKSAGGCCRNGGSGYSTILITVGKSGKKYICTECKNRQASSYREQTQNTNIPLELSARQPDTSTAGGITLISTFREMVPATEAISISTLVTTEATVPSNATTTSSATTISTMTTTITTTQPPAVHGWSSWQPWSECSLTCGVGFQTRQRTCYGDCIGREEQMQPCSLASYCPVDGRWAPWHSWSECSDTCGGGKKVRSRLCNDPPPQHNGLPCPGDETEEKLCNVVGCPVDGAWGDWDVVEICSVTCGRGVSTVRRECNNPLPQNGGATCEGKDLEKTRCELDKCPRDGDWSLWSRWTECAVTCGNSTRSRHRACDAPTPIHGGRNCTGLSEDIQMCFAQEPCPVHGNWSEWGGWSPCLAEPCKGEKGLQMRTRTCTSPQPRFGGDICVGNSTQMQECFNNFGCPVDGGWCAWTDYSRCMLSDIGMFRRRIRQCSCPLPESAGAICQGTDFQVQPCSWDGEPLSCEELQQYEGSGYLDDEDC